MTTRLCLSGLVCAAMISAGLPAWAEITPGRGAHDSRVRIATWVDGQVFRVVTSLTRVTTVEFGEGETIRSIIAGDTVGFQFDAVPGGRAFAIKPVASGVATNITVYTNRRSYYFNVQEVSSSRHSRSGTMAHSPISVSNGTRPSRRSSATPAARSDP